MKQPLALLTAAIGLMVCASFLTGCTPRPKNDPFFGAQVVPAPATASTQGAKTPPSKDYYPNNSSSRPGNTTPGTTGDKLQPPGGFGFGSGTTATRSSTGGFKSIPPSNSTGSGGTGASSGNTTPFRSPTLDATTPRSGNESGIPRSGNGVGAQIPAENNQDRGGAWPGTRSGAARLTNDTTRPTVARFDERSRGGRTMGFVDDGQEYTDIPAGGQSDSNLFRPSTRVRSAEYQEPLSKEPLRPTTARVVNQESTTDASYGYDPDYRWIKGKLEYLQASRRWKLRYVPFSRGAVDQYRGSVVLADSPELENYRPGDFVTAYGRIDEDSVARGYSTTYRASRIEPASAR